MNYKKLWKELNTWLIEKRDHGTTGFWGYDQTITTMRLMEKKEKEDKKEAENG